LPKAILITDAYLPGEADVLRLHPTLAVFSGELKSRKRQWFNCADKNPLGWYAALCDTAPAALLAEKCESLPENTRQCWVASPYHALLGRDSVRVMPEGALAWCAADARWLCETLNPLLEDDGMRLHALDAALLLTCEQALDVSPAPFAAIAGHTLPNRHPEGADGGRLMRLLSEIQMSLHGKSPEHRVGQPDIHGLWLWGACAWPNDASASVLSVATRNPFLLAVSDGRDVDCIISEAEKLPDLLAEKASLPKNIVLSGADRAVLLTKSILPRFGKSEWIPKSLQPEAMLRSALHRIILITQ